MKILIAEDNVINQKLFIKLFRALDLKPEIVSDGAEAVALVCKNDYDIVFMDIQMPLMDGMEATRKIRQFLKSDIRPIIIAITANPVENADKTYIGAGMNDYLPKPFMVRDLQLKVEYWKRFLLQQATQPA